MSRGAQRKYDTSDAGKAKRQLADYRKKVDRYALALIDQSWTSWSSIPSPHKVRNGVLCTQPNGQPTKEWSNLVAEEQKLISRMKSGYKKEKKAGTTATEYPHLVPASESTPKTAQIAHPKKPAGSKRKRAATEREDSNTEKAAPRKARSKQPRLSDLPSKNTPVPNSSSEPKIKVEEVEGGGQQKLDGDYCDSEDSDWFTRARPSKEKSEELLFELPYCHSTADFFLEDGADVWARLSFSERNSFYKNSLAPFREFQMLEPQAQLFKALKLKFKALRAMDILPRSQPVEASIDEPDINLKSTLVGVLRSLPVAEGEDLDALMSCAEAALFTKLGYQSQAVILSFMLRRSPRYIFTAVPAHLKELANAIWKRMGISRDIGAAVAEQFRSKVAADHKQHIWDTTEASGFAKRLFGKGKGVAHERKEGPSNFAMPLAPPQWWLEGTSKPEPDLDFVF